MKLFILIKRSSTISLLGIRRFDGTSLSQWLCCPHEADWFWLWWGCLRPHLNGKLTSRKSSGAEGLRLESINPDTTIYFLAKRAKSSALWSGIFLPLRYKYAIWLFTWAIHLYCFCGWEKFFVSCEVSVWGSTPDDFPRHESERQFAGLIFGELCFPNKYWQENVSRSTTYLSDLKTRKKNLIARQLKNKDCQQIQLYCIHWTWAKRTLIVSPRWMPRLRSIWRFKKVSQEFAGTRCYFLSFTDWRRVYRSDFSLKLFSPDPSSLERGRIDLPFLPGIQKRIWQETESTLPSASAMPTLLAKLAFWTMKPSIAEICAPIGLMKM